MVNTFKLLELHRQICLMVFINLLFKDIFRNLIINQLKN